METLTAGGGSHVESSITTKSGDVDPMEFSVRATYSTSHLSERGMVRSSRSRWTDYLNILMCS